jgi:ABC-type lipoprotein release transport system permease subunit
MGSYKRAIENPKKRRRKRREMARKTIKMFTVLFICGGVVATLVYALTITSMYENLRESIINNPNIPVQERERYGKM